MNAICIVSFCISFCLVLWWGIRRYCDPAKMLDQIKKDLDAKHEESLKELRRKYDEHGKVR